MNKDLELHLKRIARVVNPIISLRDVEVDFDGYKALNTINIDFSFKGVQFIIGPNGAGKTTILDAICGRVKTSKGKIIYKETHEVQNKKPESIVHLGISRKFQNPTIFNTQTVFENMKLSLLTGKRNVWYLFNHKITKEEEDTIDQTLLKLNLLEYKNVISGSMSHGQKQWLEIAMSIINEPELLLVDEPIAGMSPSERDRTGELLKEIGKDHTVLVVEHDMKFVSNFSTSVTVMHEGRIIDRGAFDKIVNNEQVIEIYLGRQN
ncbi:urea ABC transporter ATP-binding protein UrtD [Flavivirga jejuensis]|uniref:Urea ABC transporter ATP-binding protein UrtD n=1 Tax=Flavivirga jejuensis TaxID=870487 RepID=A0ABT8WKD2_9FLAO|nr:urea ABC transporter ATP-binding protein UrtD [Flavivirga jejuensis]MDO5973618.1 urea ABC transporter ATP-binding protein UrtD [Flavivirga jejuensis]